MIGDGDALVRAICEEPWENTPRLIYADWLEENGNPDRAEFIRLQIELDGIPPNERFDTPQYDRACELERMWDPPLEALVGGANRWPQRPWVAELPVCAGVVWHERYARGFRYWVTFSNMKAVRAHAGAVMSASPVEAVTIRQIQGRGEVRDLLVLPWVVRLTALSLAGPVGASGLELIARSPALNRLEHLDLSKSELGDAGLRALACSITLPNLKRLGLNGARRVTEAGLNVLLNALTLDTLRAVDGVRHILQSYTRTFEISERFYERFPDSN